VVLPLDADDGVEPLVDLLQPVRVHDRAVPERTHARYGILDVGLGAVQSLQRRRRIRIEPRKVAQQRAHAREPRGDGLPVLVEQSHGFLKSREDALGVLQTPTLRTQLVLLALPELHGIDVRQLPAVALLLPSALARLVAQLHERGARGIPARPELAQRVSRGLGLDEAIEDFELACRLHEALMLVLAVNLHEEIAQALEQADGGRRVVDKHAVPPGP